MTTTHALYLSQNKTQTSPEDLIKALSPDQISNFFLFKKFLNYSFAHTLGNEFWTRPAEKIIPEILALWEFIQKRDKNEIHVRIFNPSIEKEGFESDYTFSMISQAEAPFVNDSVQIALNNFQQETFFILNIANLCTVRNDQGELLDIVNGPEQFPLDYSIESISLLKISKQFSLEKITSLQNYLLQVLQEAHIAFQDQMRMREKLNNIIHNLTPSSQSESYLAEQLKETIAFLTWLLEDHFYFLGYREYAVDTKKNDPEIKLISGSGLGLLSDETNATKTRSFSSLPQEAQRLADAKFPLVITKTNTKSHLYRDTYTDYISIKIYDSAHQVIGEHRFIGLFLPGAYNNSIMEIPYLRKKATQLLRAAKKEQIGYSAQKLLNILETFPRDDLFQTDSEELYVIMLTILSIYERSSTRLILRKDAYGRFYSCLVYLPKEKITSSLSNALADYLLTALHGNELLMRIQLTDAALGRLHYIIRIPSSVRNQQDIDFIQIENNIIDLTKSWNEKLYDLLVERHSLIQAHQLYQRYKKAFSVSYKEDFTPTEALLDIQYIEEIYRSKFIALSLKSYDENTLSFKLFQLEQPTTLSEIIPILENMGLEALEENAYKCNLDNQITWICHYRLRLREHIQRDISDITPLFQELFYAIRTKKIENDPLNALVLKIAAKPELVNVLRAYCAYLRLIGIYSQAYLIQVLNIHYLISKKLLDLFIMRFTPDNEFSAEILRLQQEIKNDLAQVSNLEEDKILRAILNLIESTVRTNYFQLNADNQTKPYLAFKFKSSLILNLPLPHPAHEIFVYSPRFEASHMRATEKFARGGIRWSDRREDFRTEILGLMKAQQVKNAVIVPGGAKGGFVLKTSFKNTDRQNLLDEAIICYKNFMRGLLDLTDNFIENEIIHPPKTKIYDEDDPYLVVAADKGTATFSDYANEISAEYNFWLGDAFASGGSHGYDHKKIGITAKGAWISVTTHLKTLNINPTTDSFTVVGIGDMSGDVFGNGMLLSKKIQLVAAFNHVHIFIDPTPDCEKSFAERSRLFKLPRSNWTDYNPELISQGGGVFDRSAKLIKLSPEIKNLLLLTTDEIEPNELIQAILKAKVDLLFNGGIGTYVKASSEHHNEVGDKNNNNVRINANELRCKAVGEGGNLGFTQLARVEYAAQGGLIFTDFIDNSAGVDLSDHEVNIKILMNQALQKNLLDFSQRNELLSKMTDEVERLVLLDNKAQTEALCYASSQANNELEIYIRTIAQLEKQGLLNRAVEFLPSERTLEERYKLGTSLTAPEIAVVMAYIKIEIKQALLNSNVPDEAYFQKFLKKEFPSELEKNYQSLISEHQLRRAIISTQLTNQLIQRAGILFIQRLREETNEKVSQIIRAYKTAIAVFELEKLYDALNQLDFQVNQTMQNFMRRLLIRFLRRTTRWLINHRLPTSMEETINDLKMIAPMSKKLTEFLGSVGLEKYHHLIETCIAANVPLDIATALARTYYSYLLLEINYLAQKTNHDLDKVAKLYFNLGKKLKLDRLRDEITNQAVSNQWESLAHSSLRDQLDNLQSYLVEKVLSDNTTDDLETYFNQALVQYEAWHNLMQQLERAPKADYVMYAVLLNNLNQLAQRLGSGS